MQCKIDFADLFKEAEGCGFDGWVCPIWAHKEDGEIVLALGEPVSRNTSFINTDGKIPASWVGSIPCWTRCYGEGDAEVWADDTNYDAAEFDCDTEFENETDTMADNFRYTDYYTEILQAIRDYAGEPVEFE